MKIRVTVGVTLIRPACPEIVDQLVQRFVSARSSWPDAGADQAVDQHRNSFRRQWIVAHQIAHPLAQQRGCETDFRIGGFATAGPAIGAAAFGGTVIGAAQIAERDPGGIALRRRPW